MSSRRDRSVTACLIALFLVWFLGGSALGQSKEGELLWSEEFNEAAIDRDLWTFDIGGHGFGNGQLEFNTDRPENAYIEDGNLVIEARRESFGGREFTSARMHTNGRFAFQYGTLEARIQVPDTADGIWPAFWMMGSTFPGVVWPKCGEVDILEIGGKEGTRQGLQHRRINAALHFAGKDEKKESLVCWHNANVDLHNDFHVYKLVWTPESMRFFLDDEEIGGWEITGTEFREFHQPFFPIRNVAVGSWPSSYTAVATPDKVTAPLPSQLRVDWLRLYAHPDTKVVVGQEPVAAGSFGVFTESDKVLDRLSFVDGGSEFFEYSDQAALFLWNNIKPVESTSPLEGVECWSFEIGADHWFGLGVMAPQHRNMEFYEDGALSCAIRSRSTISMKIGIKSATGEVWIPLGDEKDQFGFARDGNWHRIQIPLSELKTDLRTIHQFFMLAGDPPARSARLSIDDIRWEALGSSNEQ